MKDIVINTEKLKEMKPCTDRFRNWLEHYENFSGSFFEFLDLDKISYEDKIFVVRRMLHGEILEKWAILCAESVLHIFEEKYPADKRPRECIAYLKTGEKNTQKLKFHRDAAHSAAYTAHSAAYTADAAAYTADAAAYTADAAASSASYAASSAAFYAASSDSSASASAEIGKQQTKNLEFLKTAIEESNEKN